MKSLTKIVLAFLVLGVLIFMFSCATTPPPKESDVPKWYLNPPSAEDAIYGVGSAQMATLDNSRTFALQRARDDVARQLEITIKNRLINYYQEGGEVGDTQALQFSENVSKQIVNTTMKGVKTKEVEIGKDGTVYALVEYSTAHLIEDVKKELQRNEGTEYSEFKANQALEGLDEDLKEMAPEGGQPEG